MTLERQLKGPSGLAVLAGGGLHGGLEGGTGRGGGHVRASSYGKIKIMGGWFVLVAPPQPPNEILGLATI